MKISTKFNVDTTIRCLVIELLLLTWPRDLDISPFDLGQWSYMADHVVNPSTIDNAFAATAHVPYHVTYA